MVDPNTRQGKRTPVTLKIKFKSETLEQFIERYAVDVSQGGIFIRTKEPLAVGTQMRFEFQLRDASPLIAGEGTVVWTRENDPSRPAIAPGMGVRFDRLADGSQGILERILTEKAKQAPQRPIADTAKPPLFTDTPTRVAPAPMQDALLGKDNGRGRRGDDSGHLDSHTPLPRPMPFHSDADEFPDEAFEEATKVRALDELIAQTAEGDNKPEHTSRSRPNGRGDGDPSADRPDLRPTVLPMHADQEVPDLPNPPELMRPQPRMLDTSPSPRFDTPPPPLPESLAKTRLGVEPARARVAPSTPPPPIGPVLGELPPLPSGMRAVAAEETAPARMPQLRSRSLAPLVILIFLIVAGIGAAVWFLVLRPQVTESRGGTAHQPDGSGSAAVATGSGGSAAATGATGSAAQTGGSGTGVAAASGSAARGDLVDTPITANVDGASIEITGADQSGTAPFTAKLEKGKPYKARITARGFATLELDIKGGDTKVTAKLVAKPRFVAVSSDPSGAQISVDGTSSGHSTPFEIELTAAQAAKKSVHVV
ncbi:MAG TPA: TIGR02266 family protein, partial [Kofleriaceae bacterium]|nr:TIGR02266 family protein [Kofleriaceae bacterium]